MESKTIHQLFEMCQEVAQREDTTKEQMFDGVQAIYVESCNMLGQKPMTQKQWECKVKGFQKNGLPSFPNASLDDIFAITTTVNTFDDSTNKDILSGIEAMCVLTLNKQT